MGVLRVLLALCVLLDHTHGLWGYKASAGAVAVQCFFIISGFYMGLVLNERYDRPALNRTFWINRLIRIYPMYWLFLAAYFFAFMALHLATGESPLALYASDLVSTGGKVLLGVLNVTLVGLELPLFLAAEDGQLGWTAQALHQGGNELYRYSIVAVAWSLSLELIFYTIAPFIARRPAWKVAIVFAASLGFRIWGAAHGLAGDPFSYRFFPFELAFFVLGVLAYKAWAAAPAFWDRPTTKLLALSAFGGVLFYPLLLGSYEYDDFFTPPRILVLAAVAVGLPALHAWSRMSRFDRAFGELSYPLYLCHLLVFGFVANILGRWVTNPTAITLTVAAGSLATAWIVVRILDNPIESLRRRLAREAGATDEADRGKHSSALYVDPLLDPEGSPAPGVETGRARGRTP